MIQSYSLNGPAKGTSFSLNGPATTQAAAPSLISGQGSANLDMTFGGFDANNVKTGGASASGMQLGAAFATTMIDAWSAYDSAKMQQKSRESARKHKAQLAAIEFSLNNMFANKADERGRQATQQTELAIQVGRMQAESSVLNESAGSGNISGAASVLRNIRANALQASAANEANLFERQEASAANRFGFAQKFITSTPLSQEQKISPWGYAFEGVTKAVGIGQAATAKGK